MIKSLCTFRVLYIADLFQVQRIKPHI